MAKAANSRERESLYYAGALSADIATYVDNIVCRSCSNSAVTALKAFINNNEVSILIFHVKSRLQISIGILYYPNAFIYLTYILNFFILDLFNKKMKANE